MDGMGLMNTQSNPYEINIRQQKKSPTIGRMSLSLVLSVGLSLALPLSSALAEPAIIKAIAPDTSSTITPDTTAQTDDSSIYQAEFFTQYRPQNALEMIERLPGFSFDQGSSARGFGGNAGNVLIDGSRPTSKSSGLRGALVRIPAQQVLRIEILRGGVSAGEAAGQSIVANVIRSNEGTSGTWAFKARQTKGTSVESNIEAALSTRLGGWDTSFDTDIGADPNNRTAVVETRDKDGELLFGADETFPAYNEWVFINGEGFRDWNDGKLTLNGRVGGDTWYGDTTRFIYTGQLPSEALDQNGPDAFWQLNEKNKFKVAEFGADWARTSDQWKTRLISLGLIEERKNSFQFHQQDEDGLVSDALFDQQRRKTEFVGRATYGRVSGSSLKPEYGIEVANNRLDTNALTETGPIDGSDVVVEEWRSEVFATFVYEASEKLTLEGGLTGEFSQIEVTGDSNQKQTFRYIKPRVSSTYKFNDDMRLTVEVQRTVGQLDFTDFAFSSDGADSRTTAGNPGLSPDTNTEWMNTFDWSFSERGSLKFSAFYQWRKDILEQIVLFEEDGVVAQGLGNAGDARFWGLTTEVNLPLDWLLPNGLIEIVYQHRRADFDDPIIDDERAVNWFTPNFLSFELRQDITDYQIAWGLEYDGSFTDTTFLVDEVQTFEGNKRLEFFIETTRFFGVKIQIEVEHLKKGHFKRSRLFYDQTRGGALTGSEVSRRTRRPELKLSVTGTF